MGSSNRDYMRDDFDDNSSGPAWGYDTPTTKWLIIVTVVAFFLQFFTSHDNAVVEPRRQNVASVGHLTHAVIHPVAAMGIGIQSSYIDDWFALDAVKVQSGQVWRLITYVFCHNRDNPFGLAFNMIALWFLGAALERMYGSRELLWFYLATAAFCGVVFAAIGVKVFLPFPLIGANPCILSLLTLYATHFPRQEILFCWVIPIQIRILLIVYVAIDIYMIMEAFSGQSGWAKVAYSAELWAVAFGYVYRRMNWHLSGFSQWFDIGRAKRAWRQAQSSRKLKVFQPEPVVDLDEQVDALLAKIHEHGSESLTDRERAILQKASDRAKNRLS